MRKEISMSNRTTGLGITLAFVGVWLLGLGSGYLVYGISRPATSDSYVITYDDVATASIEGYVEGYRAGYMKAARMCAEMLEQRKQRPNRESMGPSRLQAERRTPSGTDRG
jgi:hypothetical protein